MEKLLTTKDLARAIGASESSLRRWTDSGAIRTARTAGGHRRIPLSEAIRYIRQTGASVIEPAVLGLPEVASAGVLADSSQPATEQFHDALVRGDLAAARGQVIALYLSGMSIAAIGDGPIRSALDRIGGTWKHDPANILIEHRATDICVQAVSLLRQLLPAAAEDAPVAMGGAPSGDPYLLPSALAAAVAAEAGWRETNFGANTPLDLLANAAERRRASLVWLSVSTEMTPLLRKQIKELAAALGRKKILFAAGGRFVGELQSLRMKEIQVLQTMAEFSALLRGAARKSNAK